MDFAKTLFGGARLAFSLGGLCAPFGAIVSWFSTAAFKAAGWAGVGKAMLVGSGTAMGWGLLALPGMIAGGLAGGLLGFFAGRNSRDPGKTALVGGVVGAVALGVPGAFWGAEQGYSLAREWLTVAQAPTPAVRTIKTPVQAPATTITVTAPAA